MYTFRICRNKGKGSIQMVWPFFYQIMDRLGPPHAAIFCNAKICSVLDLHLAAMAIWLSCTVPVWNESSAILWSRDLAKSAFGPYCRYIYKSINIVDHEMDSKALVNLILIWIFQLRLQPAFQIWWSLNTVNSSVFWLMSLFNIQTKRRMVIKGNLKDNEKSQ